MGKLYFVDQFESLQDLSIYNNHYYWPLGPFPAILLMPFVFISGLFGKFFYQRYLQYLLVIGVFYLASEIAKKIGFKKFDQILWALVFTFGSAFIGVAWMPRAWFFSQVITVFLLFLAILEFLGKKRYLVLGTIFGSILLTRLTASLGILFLILEIIIFTKKTLPEKGKNIFILLLPFLFSLLILLVYNHLRFGNFFEQGYNFQILKNDALTRKNLGLFSIKHLPTNLYYFFVKSPKLILKFPFIVNDMNGVNIFVTSPYFIYLFFLKNRYRLSKIIWITVMIIAIPIFLYYGIGIKQYGYRYSLDFLPFLFFLLMQNYYLSYKKISKQFGLLLFFSIFINVYLMLMLLNR
ncbi:hypothetical protein A2Z22_02705 [Candidatus Woesebacteria bacterium RBG_16_34_12]|uniref:Glycosyltransferase RgtA/B/C/D-like domain-containing protein n=1 Tax=Candidatus Woesebacteria bacterium RBG_16_34_12 TaxID=1802480 RepID=A0A1F7X6X3_9BACT|nr:MAG: hypothetical protein A2Z22_02705 [Candidatus Woesebacteria bacterium RBG_16_34_12]